MFQVQLPQVTLFSHLIAPQGMLGTPAVKARIGQKGLFLHLGFSSVLWVLKGGFPERKILNPERLKALPVPGYV